MTTDPLLQRFNTLSWPYVAFDHPEPAPGQLWRAEWGGTACLVVVSGVPTGRIVPVVAATSDRIGDDRGIVARTENGMTPAVWGSVATSIKMFTLEHRITDLTTDSLERLSAVASGRQAGDWAPITSDLDDRVLARAELEGRLHDFSAAEWQRVDADDTPTLTQLAAEHDLHASALASILSITPGEARRLLQAKREPTAEEVKLLTSRFDQAPSLRMEIDGGLVEALDLPEFRPRLRLIAASGHSGDESAARRTFAGQMMALAARQRERGPKNWVTLIREEFRAG